MPTKVAGLSTTNFDVCKPIKAIKSPIPADTPHLSPMGIALIVVGFMMATGLLRVNFNDISEALPAYIAAIAMPFFYSISEGISMGVISYTVINVLSGMRVNGVMLILTALFVLKYIFI